MPDRGVERQPLPQEEDDPNGIQQSARNDQADATGREAGEDVPAEPDAHPSHPEIERKAQPAQLVWRNDLQRGSAQRHRPQTGQKRHPAPAGQGDQGRERPRDLEVYRRMVQPLENRSEPVLGRHVVKRGTPKHAQKRRPVYRHGHHHADFAPPFDGQPDQDRHRRQREG